jgi:hypothetical protein
MCSQRSTFFVVIVAYMLASASTGCSRGPEPDPNLTRLEPVIGEAQSIAEEYQDACIKRATRHLTLESKGYEDGWMTSSGESLYVNEVPPATCVSGKCIIIFAEEVGTDARKGSRFTYSISPLTLRLAESIRPRNPDEVTHFAILYSKKNSRKYTQDPLGRDQGNTTWVERWGCALVVVDRKTRDIICRKNIPPHFESTERRSNAKEFDVPAAEILGPVEDLFDSTRAKALPNSFGEFSSDGHRSTDPRSSGESALRVDLHDVWAEVKADQKDAKRYTARQLIFVFRVDEMIPQDHPTYGIGRNLVSIIQRDNGGEYLACCCDPTEVSGLKVGDTITLRGRIRFGHPPSALAMIDCHPVNSHR